MVKPTQNNLLAELEKQNAGLTPDTNFEVYPKK